METNTNQNPTATILIVEDDDFLRSLAVSKLQKVGYNVDIAIDGEDGIEKIRTTNPAVLLLDIMLPKKNGFEILQELKDESHPIFDTCKILVFSNLGSEEDIRRGTELGAHDYLIKSSFTLDELVEKVGAALQ